MSHYSTSDVAVTKPPCVEGQRGRKHEQVELLKVVKPNKPARQSLGSYSSPDSCITALPTIGKIGCLPEGSYSQLDVTRDFRGLDRQ